MFRIERKQSRKIKTSCNDIKEVHNFLIDKRKESGSENHVAGKEMGHKKLNHNNVTQSLPNCLFVEKKSEDTTFEGCDINYKLLEEHNHPDSPWFKTWPERCDKLKTTSGNTFQNTQNLKKCDNVENGVKNTFTLKEALENISLAYSPVTKQLHVIEKDCKKYTGTIVDIKAENDFNEIDNIVFNVCDEKKGHRRIQAGSFSSTISSLSEPSTSKSLLDADEKSINSYDLQDGNRKHSIRDFFNRNVFLHTSSVWKLLTNKTGKCINSPHSVVSSTALIQHPRPSNLPAKTLEEEHRHRQEYKAMLAAVRRKETQNTIVKQKLQKVQLQQEEHQAATTKHFLKYVLPGWEQMRDTKKTRDLWWQGLPSSIRGKVWYLAIGNELNLTPQLYEICLLRAQNRLNSPLPSHHDVELDKESSMDVIQLDISRTFPHLCIFQEGGPYSDMLHSLLAAYVCYRPDVGYVQGMSYIAAVLILNMEACEAFMCFANLLNQRLHLSAFTLNQDQMEAYYNAYNELFLYNLPKLYQHFEEAKLTPDLYLLDWIYTVFAKAMPLDVACRIWDIFLRDGDEFIFRTAIGILHLNQDTLITMDFLHGAQFLTRLPDDLSSDQLFKSIQSVTTNVGKQTFNHLVDKYSTLCR